MCAGKNPLLSLVASHTLLIWYSILPETRHGEVSGSYITKGPHGMNYEQAKIWFLDR